MGARTPCSDLDEGGCGTLAHDGEQSEIDSPGVGIESERIAFSQMRIANRAAGVVWQYVQRGAIDEADFTELAGDHGSVRCTTASSR